MGSLADLDQERVASLLERDRYRKTIKTRSIQPLLARQNLVAVQPDGQIVVGTASQLDSLLPWRFDFGVGEADCFLGRAENLDQIHLTQRVGWLMHAPFQLTRRTAVILCRQIQFLLGGI